MEELLNIFTFNVTHAIEAAALVVIVVGFVLALAVAVKTRLEQGNWTGTYTELRKQIGRTLLLGLEFLVAAEIVRSIAVDETLEAVLILGIVVIVRTILSVILEMEISGHWPWQAHHARTYDVPPED